MVTIDDGMDSCLRNMKFSVIAILGQLLFLIFYLGMFFYLELFDGYVFRWMGAVIFVVMILGTMSSYRFFLIEMKRMNTYVGMVKKTNDRIEELIKIGEN